MTKEERVEMYMAFLVEEGFRPKIEDDDDLVSFKYEGRTYYIIIDEEDEEFFRLVYPNFWEIEDESELAEAKEAAMYATAKTKVAKVFITTNNDVWATVELFCAPPETFKSVLSRCLSAVRSSIESFVSKMREVESLPVTIS